MVMAVVMNVVAPIEAIAEIDVPMAMVAAPVDLIDSADLSLCRGDAAWVPGRHSAGRLGDQNASHEGSRSR
jgi:hypothetical protein